MKKLIVIVCTIFCANILVAQPAWVKIHPVLEKEYAGIGMCPVSDADHIKKAAQNAMADISSQISLKVENNSLLHLIDVDGKSREMLEDKINTSISAWIEGQQLKDSYTDGNTYYVYYVLDKDTYAKNAEKKRNSVIAEGLGYLQQGRELENSMNLAQAAQVYAKGLEVVEPWAFMDLTTMQEGYPTNISEQLYNSLAGVFSNMAITTNVAVLEGESFKPIATPIAACLSKNGVVVPNVKLKAEFVSGSGSVSKPIETDYNGTTEFYVNNITSKEKIQEVRISIDDSFIESIPASMKNIVNQKGWPTAKVTITLQNAPVTCYFMTSNDHDLEGIERNVSSLLNNNYFVITEDKVNAEYFAELTTKLEMGNVVSGGTYNMNSCYCTLVLKIYDNQTQNLLLTYTVNGIKVLTPVQKTSGETISMCNREVMKRVNRELPAQLKKLNN